MAVQRKRQCIIKDKFMKFLTNWNNVIRILLLW